LSSALRHRSYNRADTKSGSCWYCPKKAADFHGDTRDTRWQGSIVCTTLPSLCLQSDSSLHSTLLVWRDGQQSSLQACTLSSFLFFSPLLCVGFRVLTGLVIVEQRVCYDAEGATAIYLGYTWREEHINVYVDLTPFPLSADALLCYLQLWTRTNAEQVSCSFFYRGLHHRMLKLRLYEAISCQIIQRGPPDSAYAGGEYHGQLIFPSEYPFKPPGIKVRFVIHYDVLTVVSQWIFDIWLIYLDADPVGKISAWQKNLLLDVGFSSGNCKFGWPSRCAYTYLIRLIVESLLERSYNVSMYIPLPHLRHSSSPVLCRFLFEGPLSLHGIFTVRPTCRTSDDTMDFSSVMIHVNSWNSTY